MNQARIIAIIAGVMSELSCVGLSSLCADRFPIISSFSYAVGSLILPDGLLQDKTLHTQPFAPPYIQFAYKTFDNRYTLYIPQTPYDLELRFKTY